MKILFISSNLYSQFPACFPNGVGALAAYLRREGHEVCALHLFTRRDLQRIPRLLRKVAPDVVGISVVTCETRIIEPVCAMARAWRRQVPVLVGGIHAIVSPESVMQVPGVDGVCCGEGELALHLYLQRLQAQEDVSTTPGFVFRKEGSLTRNPPLPFIEDLDSLPMMDRSVTDLQRVIDANNGVLNVIFSRGCPWSCRFCCNRQIRAAGTGTYARLLSIGRVIEELKHLRASYRFEHILFRDDTFTWAREWSLELVKAYSESLSHPFDIFSRVDCLDGELLGQLAAAGCRHIFLGLDSGNDFIRNKVLHKEQDNADLFRVVQQMKQLGIIPMISNIVGLPHETPEMFGDTIEINRKIHEDQVVFSPSCGACPKIWVFTPWPGSDLYSECERRGWLVQDPGQRKVYRESVLQMPQFPRRQIERAYRRFRYNVYRERFPLHALLFLAYDSRPVQWLFERIPLAFIGQVRRQVLRAMRRLGRGWDRFSVKGSTSA